jgi:hypothetical protein
VSGIKEPGQAAQETGYDSASDLGCADRRPWLDSASVTDSHMPLSVLLNDLILSTLQGGSETQKR